jgi:signal transduction histidine kinase
MTASIGASRPRGWLARAGALAAGLASQLPRSALALPLALVAAAGVVVINETSHASSMKALSRLQQRAEATVRMQAVLRRVLDAESGQRGYMLTGREVYLEPYTQAAADTRRELAWLGDYLRDDPVSAALLDALRPHADAKLGELALSVAAYDAGDRDRWIPLLDSPSGRHHMAALRGISTALLARERGYVAAERQAVFDNLRRSRRGVNATAAVGILALLLLLRKSAALDAIQQRHTQDLQAESERLDAEVQRRTGDLSELARHLHTVREDESSRLARELQQELGALLAATKMDLARLRRGLADASPEVLARLDHLRSGIDSGIALKRRIIESLRPSALANLGLVSALEIQLRDFAERSGVQVQSDLQALEMSEAAQITVYRLVQEALTNIAKYAGARQVRVGLAASPGPPPAASAMGNPAVDGAVRQQVPWARLTVSDDGKGFDPQAPQRSAHGLRGMRFRVEAVGGRFSVHSAPGQGTRIAALLPTQPLNAASPRSATA